MTKLKVLLTFGTRPEAIKMAPVIRCCQNSRQIESVVCVTGQHRQMLDQVVEYFGIHIDRDLELMAPDQTLADLTSRCLTGLDAVISEYRPDCIVAQGDTTTVMAAFIDGVLSPKSPLCTWKPDCAPATFKLPGRKN